LGSFYGAFMMKPPRVEPEFFDLAGASAFTAGGLSVRSLRRLISQGRLRCFRLSRSGKVLVSKTDLLGLIESCEVKHLDLDVLAAEAVAELHREGR
jgi:hypothetical protein